MSALKSILLRCSCFSWGLSRGPAGHWASWLCTKSLNLTTENTTETDYLLETISACPIYPLLKTTLTGLRRTYLRFLVFRPKLGETKRFPPFLDHMNGKFFLGGSRFWSGKIDPKLAVGGCVAAQPWLGALSKIDDFGHKTSTFLHKKSKKEIFKK